MVKTNRLFSNVCISKAEIDNEQGKNDKLCSTINYSFSPEMSTTSMNANVGYNFTILKEVQKLYFSFKSIRSSIILSLSILI